jgi:hypothetical protein
MLPGPSKGSQPYAPKTRSDICWPKFKGPWLVLSIFKPCFEQICALYSLFTAILLPPIVHGKFLNFLSILNYLAVATAILNICFLYVLGQSGADVLRNPSYFSLKLSSALRVQVFIFSRIAV